MGKAKRVLSEVLGVQNAFIRELCIWVPSPIAFPKTLAPLGASAWMREFSGNTDRMSDSNGNEKKEKPPPLWRWFLCNSKQFLRATY